ncbi:MAG: hypothetical protein ACREFG_04200, partial [Chthoniobacterales bacterium]
RYTVRARDLAPLVFRFRGLAIVSLFPSSSTEAPARLWQTTTNQVSKPNLSASKAATASPRNRHPCYESPMNYKNRLAGFPAAPQQAAPSSFQEAEK